MLPPKVRNKSKLRIIIFISYHCIEALLHFIFSFTEVSKQLDEILIPEINEYYLFHGTKSDKIDKIGQQGIDSRVCAENAMFGRGAYFAESPTKADQYAGKE